MAQLRALGCAATCATVCVYRQLSLSLPSCITFCPPPTSTQIRKLRGIAGPVFQVAFSPDKSGSQVAVACFDSVVRVYRRATGDLLLSMPNVVRPPLTLADPR
jgi:hypothetical protein